MPKKDALTSAVLVGIVVIAAIYVMQSGILGAITAPTYAVTARQPMPAAPSAGNKCPDDGTYEVLGRIRNPLNSSLDYDVGTPTMYIFEGTKERKSATTTGATYASLSTPCSAGDPLDVTKFDVYIIGSSSISSGKGSISSTGYADLLVPERTGIKRRLWDMDTSTNATNGDDQTNTGGWILGTTGTSDEITMGSGETKALRLDIQANSTFKQFGSNGMQDIVCFNFAMTEFSKDSGVTLGGMTQVAVPSGLPASDGMDKCYVLPTEISSSDGILSYPLTLKTDLGDGATDITIYFYDMNYYLGADGSIKTGYNDDSITNIGITNPAITIDIA